MKDKKILVGETILEASDYLKKLIIGVETYIDELSHNNYKEAAIILPDIIDGLDWEYKVLYYMAPDLKEDFELMRCKDLFLELSHALGINDTVVIKDIFSYEILPLLKKWSEYLEAEVKLINNIS